MRTAARRFDLLASIAISVALLSAPSRAGAEPAGSGVCASATDAPKPVQAALDAVLHRIVAGSDLGAAPGAVLSVRGPGWRYVKAEGLADPEAGVPIDCAMPFQIGSNTKMMTAVVLLQLQEEGKLSVDDPLSKHLPEIAARLPNGGAMTLRQLAQHTSGVFSYTDNAPDGEPGLMEGGTTDPQALRRQVSPEDVIDFVVEHGAPLFPPGKSGAWSYSNTGYTLLGLIIERVEGLPLEKVFETRIFGPLGMDNSYLWNGIPRPDFGLPRSYLVAPFDYETTEWNMSQGGAAGGVISTVDDMHAFIEALVGGVLFDSPGTLALMQDTVPTSSPAEAYGIGLERTGPDLWGHGGQTLGYISAIDAFNGRDISFVAWGNTSMNPLALGAANITDALRSSGALAE